MLRILCGVLVLTLLALPAAAVEKQGGLSVSYVIAAGDLADVQGNGYGFGAIFDYPLAGIIDVTGSLGWLRLGGTTVESVETESQSFWEFAAGPQADFGRLYLGLEAGYYTHFSEWGLVPNVGIRKGIYDVGVRYKLTEDGQFYCLRMGFFF